MNDCSFEQVKPAYVMKIVCDTIGIKGNEATVYDKFISDIKFENNRSMFLCRLKKIDQYYWTITNLIKIVLKR